MKWLVFDSYLDTAQVEKCIKPRVGNLRCKTDEKLLMWTFHEVNKTVDSTHLLLSPYWQDYSFQGDRMHLNTHKNTSPGLQGWWWCTSSGRFKSEESGEWNDDDEGNLKWKLFSFPPFLLTVYFSAWNVRSQGQVLSSARLLHDHLHIHLIPSLQITWTRNWDLLFYKL